MYDLILKNCNIINEDSIFESDIAIKNDRIELISTDIQAESKETIDVNGRYVMPGLIDDQVHFREPGLTHKGDIASESFAGLAGGVTSYFEMPNVNPATTTLENLDKKFELASQRSLSNFSFHLGATNSNLEEIKNKWPSLKPKSPVLSQRSSNKDSLEASGLLKYPSMTEGLLTKISPSSLSSKMTCPSSSLSSTLTVGITCPGEAGLLFRFSPQLIMVIAPDSVRP